MPRRRTPDKMRKDDKRRKRALPPEMAARTWKKGESGNPSGKTPGKPLLSRVRELLAEKSLKRDGTYNTRFDDVANAFVEKMEEGSFIHTKEFIDREEGRVPQRVANADGTNLKMYVGMPVDDDEEGVP